MWRSRFKSCRAHRPSDLHGLHSRRSRRRCSERGNFPVTITTDRIPFLATPGGTSHTIATAYTAERIAAIKARDAYREKLGVFGLWGSDRGITGLVVNKDEPLRQGWRIAKDARPETPEHVLIVPDGKQRKTVKALRAELAALPSLPDAHEFSRRIKFGGYCTDKWLMWASWESIGDAIIISVPRMREGSGQFIGSEKGQFIPPDCTELKLSDYHRMREEHEAAQKAKATATA